MRKNINLKMFYTNVICGMGVPYGTPSSAFIVDNQSQAVTLENTDGTIIYLIHYRIDERGVYEEALVFSQSTSRPISHYIEIPIASNCKYVTGITIRDNIILFENLILRVFNGESTIATNSMVPLHIYRNK